MQQFNFIIIFTLFSAGCAVQSRKDQLSIKSYFTKQKHDLALKELENSELRKDKKNKLLYLMEKGRILYVQSKYFEASQIFYKANELVDKLYTKKIREKILSSVGNDNSETYYGSVFERSMLYYYQAQCFYKIYQEGEYSKNQSVTIKKDGKTKQVQKKIKVKLNSNQKRQYLNRARASIVAWNSFFDDLNRSNTETLYRSDLLGKIFAANIHEAIGRKDRQITLQLYKDARKFLMTQGHTYKHFDSNYQELTRNLQDKLGNSSLSLNQNKFKKTSQYQELLDFLNYKILSLTWKIRRPQYNQLLKQFGPSKSVLERLKESKELANTSIILERKVIQSMEAKTFDYSLNSALQNIEDPTSRALVEGIGIPIITYFAMGPLGLGTYHQTRNTVIYTRHDIGTTMVKHTGIEFEMPIVKSSPVTNPLKLFVYKKANGKDELVATRDFVVASPNNDIAEQAANERAAASYKKVGVRVAVKHAIAILAAYQTYKSMRGNDGSNEFLAKSIAFAQYMASSKVIAASEKADIRHWTTLPAVINITDLYLSPGEYHLKVRPKSVKRKVSSEKLIDNSVEKDLGIISVTNSGQKKIFTYQL